MHSACTALWTLQTLTLSRLHKLQTKCGRDRPRLRRKPISGSARRAFGMPVSSSCNALSPRPYWLGETRKSNSRSSRI
eukprot:316540-Prymnesium_polylepis.2